MKKGIQTQEQMQKQLKGMGLSKVYKPYHEIDSGNTIALCLLTRKPVTITNGVMKGSEIDVYDVNTFRVWTSRKHLAAQIAKEQGFKVRLLDGEAELFIPASRGDEFLHKFGAKVKSNRRPGPETIAKAQAGLKLYRANMARIE